MIYIKDIGGRLGNSLFQLAAAIGVAKKNNDEVNYPDWKYARYFEGDFNSSSALDTMWGSAGTYREPHFHYAEIPYFKDMAIEGYFQSERYFEHCSKFVRKAFKPKPVNTDIVIEPNSCFVHVRRGDYTNLQDHHPLKTWDNYYKEAIARMDSWFPTKYYVFSDDISKVMDEFPQNDLIEYVNGGDEITDLYLMTKCKYHIIGNSSFSWWAAYLSENREGQTIAPKQWFGPALAYHNLKDLLPQSWMTV